VSFTDGAGARIPGDVLLARVSRELAALEIALAAVQEAVADLTAQAPLEPDMLRRLQALDVVTQTAENLARVTAEMASAHPDAPEASRLIDRIGMKDLAARLLSAPSDVSLDPHPGQAVSPGAGANGDGEVSWF